MLLWNLTAVCPVKTGCLVLCCTRGFVLMAGGVKSFWGAGGGGVSPDVVRALTHVSVFIDAANGFSAAPEFVCSVSRYGCRFYKARLQNRSMTHESV